MAKFEVTIGRNGSGKTSYIFDEYKKKIKENSSKVINNARTRNSLNLVLFIPSIRVESNFIIVENDDNDVYDVEQYAASLRQIDNAVNNVNEFIRIINTMSVKKRYYIAFIEKFIEVEPSYMTDKINKTFSNMESFIEEFKRKPENFDALYDKLNDGMKSFMFILGQIIFFENIKKTGKLSSTVYVYIDEIENHLYPDSLQLMLECIDAIIPAKSEVYITTHNPLTLYSMPQKSNEIRILAPFGPGKFLKFDNKGRYHALDIILEEVFAVETIRKEDVRFFELIDKYMIDELETHEFHELHEIKLSKYKNDRSFYLTYINYMKLIDELGVESR